MAKQLRGNKRKLRSSESVSFMTNDDKSNYFEIMNPKKLRLSPISFPTSAVQAPSSPSSSSSASSSTLPPSSPSSSSSSSTLNVSCEKKHVLGFAESQNPKRLKNQQNLFETFEYQTATDINDSCCLIEDSEEYLNNDFLSRDIEMINDDDDDVQMLPAAAAVGTEGAEWIDVAAVPADECNVAAKVMNTSEQSNSAATPSATTSSSTTSTDIVLYSPTVFSSICRPHFDPSRFRTLEKRIMREAIEPVCVPKNLQIPGRMFCWKIGRPADSEVDSHHNQLSRSELDEGRENSAKKMLRSFEDSSELLLYPDEGEGEENDEDTRFTSQFNDDEEQKRT